MTLNRSSSLEKQLSKAAGEALVTYKLSRRGWLVINANSGVQNMPNFDLIAMRGDDRVTIQVKAAKSRTHCPLSGTYRPDGMYFNSKDGPKADVIAFVRLGEVDEGEVYLVPVEEANSIAKELGDYHAARKASKGSSLRFPIWCRVKGVTAVEGEAAAMERIVAWRDADLSAARG